MGRWPEIDTAVRVAGTRQRPDWFEFGIEDGLGGLTDRELDLHQGAFEAGRLHDRFKENFAAGTRDFVAIGLDPGAKGAERGMAGRIRARPHDGRHRLDLPK